MDQDIILEVLVPVQIAFGQAPLVEWRPTVVGDGAEDPESGHSTSELGEPEWYVPQAGYLGRWS